MASYDDWKFPHESLHVYRDARDFLRQVRELEWPRGLGELKRQVERAALSILLNLCEGRAQRYAGNSGSNFYRIALGSAAECHGGLEALEILGESEHPEEIRLLRRIGARVSGLVHAAR